MYKEKFRQKQTVMLKEFSLVEDQGVSQFFEPITNRFTILRISKEIIYFSQLTYVSFEK